ncbi:MAG TPA: hypothetical protein VE983_09840, partial [Solirubrobacteraceae bacterium]|nr:hypothetical protein [Solirubrobacteraceae bacterium]
PAGLIVLTRYQRGAEWRPVQRGPAEGALALLEHAVAVRSRPREALAAAARLTESARVFSGTRGEASATVDSLMELAARSQGIAEKD